jgi:ribosomal protein L7/L12
MPRADVQVSFVTAESLHGLARFGPGEFVRGQVRVRADENVRCNHLRVRLAWHTEGRGTRDGGQVAEQDVFQGQLAAGGTTEHPFEFLLPPEPWSYAGHYVNIVWTIHVDVDVPWAVNVRHEQPFLCLPRRRRNGTAAPVAPDPASQSDVTITDVGAAPNQVVAIVQQIVPALSEEHARRIVAVAPFTVLRGVSDGEANRVADLLYQAGASVEISPAGGTAGTSGTGGGAAPPLPPSPSVL